MTRACLYAVGYLHCTMLAQIMSCTTGTSSSQYRLSTHPGISSDLVAFFGFSCFKAALTKPIEGVGGFSSLKDDAMSSSLGIVVSGRFNQGLVNTF